MAESDVKSVMEENERLKKEIRTAKRKLKWYAGEMQKRIDDLRGTFPPEGAFVLGGSLKAPKELPPLQSTGSVGHGPTALEQMATTLSQWERKKLPQGPMTLAPEIVGFMDRMKEGTTSSKRYQQEGVEHRYRVEQWAAAERARDIGAKNWPEFRTLLICRFGNLMRAWREGLDMDGNGRLSFVEFCDAVRTLGYIGNVKALWEMMGGHNTGFLGQNDIDPDMHEAMAEFRKKILANQPNMVTAWMTLLDPGKANRCPKELFLKVCDDIGCKEQGKKLFKWFDFNHSGDITLEELDPMAYQQMQRGDHELGLLVNEHEEPRKKTEMTFWERSTTECSRRYAASGKAAKEAIEAAAAAAAGSDVSASSLAGFKGMLMRRYGNVFRAWKDVLDTDKSGKLSFYEFCVSVRNLGYSGNMKALWHALDTDEDGFIQLEDISPEEGALMKDFKQALATAHGTLLRAWKTIDDDGSGRIERKELKTAMDNIKWDGDVDKIFDMLDYDHSGFISVEEIDIDTARALARGDDILFGLDFSPEKHRAGPDATFHERQAAHAMHMRKEAAGKMRKKRVAELAEQKKQQDVGARDKAGFLKVLQGKYGNVYRAWKVGMDTDGNGRLSKNEFMEVARHHGYAGKLLDLWNECCKPTDSFVRLDDLSPEAYKMTTEFTDLIVREYGSRNSGGRLSTPDKKKELVETWLRAWICALDTDKTGRVELGEFQEVCTKLNFGYDDAYVKRLYYWYDYDRSGAISLEELDVAASQAMQRGDSRFLDVSWCRKLDAVGNMDNVMAMADRAQNEVAKERRAKAVAQRKKHDEEKKAEKEKDMGMTSLKDLRKVLILKYGNMYRAWNLYLDKDKSGSLTFLEFCDQLRGLGYGGDLKAIWEELDEDDGGTISFVEFCPKEAVLVDGLKHAMIQKSGSIARCWVEQFDTDKSGLCEKAEFLGACERINYGQDQAEKIFKLFDLDRSGSLALEEIDEEACRVMMRGDVELGLDLMVHDNSDGKTMAQRRKEALMKAQRDELAELMAAEKAMDIRASDKAGFVSELKRKFGNLYRAWSLAMDTSGDGKLTFQEFGNAVRMQSYGGDIKALWKTYVKEGQIEGGEIVTLQDFCPAEYELVTEFRTKMIAKHRSLARGWVECLDTVKNGRVDKDRFVAAVGTIGYEQDPVRLFELYDFDRSGTITLEEIDKNAQASLAAGDVELGLDVPREDMGDKSQLTFEERQMTEAQRRQLAIGKAEREDQARREAEKKALDIRAQNPEDFKKELRRKYGNMFRAWKNGMDNDGNGKLTFIEFSEAVRMQSYGGDIRELWNYFDQDNSDIITLKEFDPESHKLTSDFKELLVAMFGSVVKGWTDCLDKEKIMRCPKDRFLAACETIGYPHDANKLYTYYDTDQSQFISLEEIDVKAHEAFLQGRQEKAEDGTRPGE